MRFGTIVVDGAEQAAIRVHGDAWAPLDRVDATLRGDLLTLIEREWPADRLHALGAAAERLSNDRLVPLSDATYAPPYRRPHKIWGIGLNYKEHAADLEAEHPDQPASFVKADHTVIGPGDPIRLPEQSERVTAEAELGLVFGRSATSVSEPEALDYLFGVCAILDQTAEDILALNPRYLTRSKNFPTFFSFGPEVVTIDEAIGDGGELDELNVATVRNHEPVRGNTVANMAHGPRRLVGFHTAMMPFFAGDIISTGTPGAVVIEDGDLAEARIDGLLPLTNPVVRVA